MWDRIKEIVENFKMFFQGATDLKRKSKGMIENEIDDEIDNFMLICFADNLGIPISISYYTLEILPYLAEDMERWSKKMSDRKSIWEDKFGDYDMDP
ncbi:hypothetical protein [Clostridiisalibacter paucivorans]|uniref:hypothetical protein n=1 Tax=Clostridiisalibacter paucivorans TaxID=408753 RepID=UPI00047BCBDE|nr:hypothetical protein [Clostridiisalibacter paucivorans]